MHHEVGVGGLEQSVVLCRLDAPVLGVETCRADRGPIDGIGRRNDSPGNSPQAGTGVEVVDAGGGHDALVEVRTAAVMSDVIEADVDCRNPEDLGPRQLRLGDPRSGLSRSHDQKAGHRKAAGRWQG